MNLKAYLAQIDVSIKDFCDNINCNPSYMSQIINGRKKAGHRLAKDVLEATDGEVKLETKLRKRQQQQNDPQHDHHQSADV